MQQEYLQDRDIIRLENKTFGLYLCSAQKGPAFYGNTTKTVTYHDGHSKEGRTLTLPVLEEIKSEVLRLTVCSKQVGPLSDTPAQDPVPLM